MAVLAVGRKTARDRGGVRPADNDQTGGKGRGWLALLAPLGLTGSEFRVFLALLFRNASRIHWRCWFLVPLATLIVALGSLVGWCGRLVQARALRQGRLAGPPIFILGHWRSGTTLLHELICLDNRFAFPSHYECFLSSHAGVTAPLAHRIVKWLGPQKRPMDDMKATFAFPGEDEAALRNLGAPSLYNSLFFPSRIVEDEAGLELRMLPPGRQEEWKRAFTGFIQGLNLRHGRPLVLKSPTHTARVGTLLELFPDARFIHIVRDPREVHPSMIKTWRTLSGMISMERSSDVPEQRIFAIHRLLHRRFREDRGLLAPGQFSEVRFEDLTRDPCTEMARIYRELGLEGFSDLEPRIRDYFRQRDDVRPERRNLAPDWLARIETELAEVMADNGYPPRGEGW